MTIMLTEVYDAFMAAGVPDDKARKAAEALSSTEPRFDKPDARIDKLEATLNARNDRLESKFEARFVKIDGEQLLLKWMIGFVLAFQLAIFAKLFLH
jgi:hypothetical protein